jgi:biopolymer transport protein ExbD
LSRKGRGKIVIDMTPFVDIAFLLVIFFMTTSQFKPPEPLTVSLPSSHSEFKIPESNVLVLYVDAQGTMAIQEGLTSTDPVGIENTKDLAMYISTKRAQNRAIRMAISADADVPYGVMSDVMKVLQETHTTRFNLVTEFESSEGKSFFGDVAGGGH